MAFPSRGQLVTDAGDWPGKDESKSRRGVQARLGKGVSQAAGGGANVQWEMGFERGV